MRPIRTILGSLLVLVLAGCQAAPATPAPPGSKPEAAQPSGAPAAAPSSEQPTRGGTLRATLYGDSETLDPALVPNIPERTVARAIFDSLTDLDDKGNVKPGLASSWTTPDPSTYVFQLRPGVKFHDGTELTAEAVKFNLERILDPATRSLNRSQLLGIKAIEVVDGTTIKISLAAPEAPLLAALADAPGMISSPTAIQKWGPEYGLHPVGTGPFVFVEQVKGAQVKVRRNPDYWEAGKPYLDEIIFLARPDTTVNATGLRTGELEIADRFPLQAVQQLKSSPGIVVSERPGFNLWMIQFNMARPPFDQKALRQAVAWAIDREAIGKVSFQGTGQAAYGPILPGHWAFDPSYRPYQRDLDKAKQKLAEGGQPNGFKFTAMVAQDPVRLEIAQLVQAQLAQAGIEMAIEPLDFAAQTQRQAQGDFESRLFFWGYRADPHAYLSVLFHSDGSYATHGHWRNARADELITSAAQNSDQAGRSAAYHELEQVMADEVPYLIFYFGSDFKAYTSKLQNFTHFQDGVMRFKDTWLKR